MTVLFAQRVSWDAGHTGFAWATDCYFWLYTALGKPVGAACEQSAARVNLAWILEDSDHPWRALQGPEGSVIPKEG